MRCQQNDLSAFELIYRQYEQPLLNAGLRMLGKKEDAEDAIQLAFMKLFRGLKNFKFQAKLSTYLFRIMFNVCFDLIEKRKRHATRDLDGIERGFSPTTDLRLQLEDAISTLPDRMRACFVLFAVEGVKQEEIAEMLELSVGAVKSHVFQAKRKLRAIMAESNA